MNCDFWYAYKQSLVCIYIFLALEECQTSGICQQPSQLCCARLTHCSGDQLCCFHCWGEAEAWTAAEWGRTVSEARQENDSCWFVLTIYCNSNAILPLNPFCSYSSPPAKRHCPSKQGKMTTCTQRSHICNPASSPTKPSEDVVLISPPTTPAKCNNHKSTPTKQNQTSFAGVKRKREQQPTEEKR